MVTGAGSVARDTDDHALSTYLERHLSGSDVAVRLVDGLHGRASNQEERDFLERFSRELEDERAVLHSIIDGLDHGEGLVQRGIGIATGVAAMAKAVLPGSPDELEALEALTVGVWGKRLLWGALQTVADSDERFDGLPLGALSRQAEDQERELVGLRQRAVTASLLC
jgi:hypothetical protein